MIHHQQIMSTPPSEIGINGHNFLKMVKLNKSVKMSKKINFSYQESYKKVSAANLILFVINLTIENKEKCTFEKLARECFTLFPKVFGFSRYPEWPDSRKLDRPLRLLRKKKLITGNPQTVFSLTKNGKKVAEETAKTFFQRKLFK